MEIAAGKTFVEFWKSLTITERDELSIALKKKCNISLTTVPRWGIGARTPKPQSQEIIVKYLQSQGYDVDQKTLFPN